MRNRPFGCHGTHAGLRAPEEFVDKTTRAQRLQRKAHDWARRSPGAMKRRISARSSATLST